MLVLLWKSENGSNVYYKTIHYDERSSLKQVYPTTGQVLFSQMTVFFPRLKNLPNQLNTYIWW